MVIKGMVEEVRFRNADNGFSIVIMNCADEIIPAVGIFPSVSEGETLELSGEFTVHARFGKQFKVSGLKICQPSDNYSIAKYLSSGVVKGVKEKTAARIVEKFGADTLKIIEKSPERLAEIKGISLKRAKQIALDIVGASQNRAAIMFLIDAGITSNLANKIYEKYGNKTVAVVKTNPYKLVEDVRGIGFFKADEIARGLGIAEDSEFRLRASLVHALTAAADHEGSTYLPKSELFLNAIKLVGSDNADSTRLSAILDKMAIERKVVYVGEDAVMLRKLYSVESGAAARLIELSAQCDKSLHDITDDISEFEIQSGITLHETQREALNTAINSGISVITGGPGTGKTTIIKCLIFLLHKYDLSYTLLAPTGRAAKRMEESTNCSASTIHRAVFASMRIDEDGYEVGDSGEGLESDVVIVDEFSMVDVFLFKVLLDSVKAGAKLIIVGDSDQLPSVGAGNVLRDITSCGLVPVTRLSYIYRQAGESLIVTNAHKINRGLMPTLDKTDSDFFFFKVNGTDKVAAMAIDLVCGRIKRFNGYDSDRIQVLCPMKNGDSGVISLNRRLQERLNPPSSDKKETVFANTVFREGDRIMHVVNNYELEWTRNSVTGKGVFNGDSGYIESVNNAGEITVVFDDDRRSVYTGDSRKQLILSYAITVHKSQGSEFDVIVLPLPPPNPVIMTRNLLYTALTRAKKMAVLVGSEDCVKAMVKNDYVQKRYSYLAQFIIDASRDYNLLFNSKPRSQQ